MPTKRLSQRLCRLTQGHKMMRRLLLSSWLCVMPFYAAGAAYAQVDVGQLGAAQRYDSEPLNQSNGGLDPALWQGVSAQQAGVAIGDVNLAELSELPQSFTRLKGMMRRGLIIWM